VLHLGFWFGNMAPSQTDSILAFQQFYHVFQQCCHCIWHVSGWQQWLIAHTQIDIPDFPLNWHGDKEFVRSFLQHGFCQPQLGSLHRCRMYLQVLWLLDITTATGDRLLTTNWQDYSPNPSEYKWPAATKLSQSDWHTWDLALATAFQAGRNAQLAYPLGNYFLENNKGWYYDPLEQALWYRNDHQWSCHGKIPSRSRTQMFHRQGEPDSPTNQLCRATVQERDTKLILTGSGKIDTALSKPDGITALAQHQYGKEWKWELTIVGNLQTRSTGGNPKRPRICSQWWVISSWTRRSGMDYRGLNEPKSDSGNVFQSKLRRGTQFIPKRTGRSLRNNIYTLYALITENKPNDFSFRVRQKISPPATNEK